MTQVLLKIIQGQSPEPGETPESIVSQIRSCWERGPDRRPSIDALCAVLEDTISELADEAHPNSAAPAAIPASIVGTVVLSHVEPEPSALDAGQVAQGSTPGADGYVLVDRPVLQPTALPPSDPTLDSTIRSTLQAPSSAGNQQTPAVVSNEITDLDGGADTTVRHPHPPAGNLLNTAFFSLCLLILQLHLPAYRLVTMAMMARYVRFSCTPESP